MMMATTNKLFILLIFSALCYVTITSGAEFACHELCRCQKTLMNCRRVGLNSIPKVSSEIVTLDLSGNDFVNITSLPLIPHLRHLNLSFNSLSNIGAPAFQRLSELETLDLSFNSLQFLHPGLFSGLYGLKYVNLSHNFLHLDDDRMHQPTNFRKLDIETLDLSSNGLTKLSQNLMGFFNSIKTLQLSKNRFKFLDSAPLQELMINLKRTKYEISLYIDDNEGELKFEELFFKDLQMKTLRLRRSGITELTFLGEVVALNLDLSENPLYIKTWKVNPHLGRTCEELYLSYVALQTKDINFLNFFSNLRILDLSRNALYLLDGQATINMPFLHTLDVSQNKYLNELSLDFCQSLTTLERLNLSGCAFERIDPLIISELGSLSVLDLSYNNFQVLSDIYSGIFETVRTINVSFNPFHCNCEMLWFVNWTRSEKFLRSSLMLNDFICFSPITKPIKEMSLSDFKCREPVIFNITKNMTFVEGDNKVTFQCMAESDPPPTLTWISPDGFKQSNRPSANRTRYIMSSFLKLGRLKKKEQGWYECMAENQLGRSVDRAYLKVLERGETSVLPTSENAFSSNLYTSAEPDIVTSTLAEPEIITSIPAEPEIITSDSLDSEIATSMLTISSANPFYATSKSRSTRPVPTTKVTDMTGQSTNPLALTAEILKSTFQRVTTSETAVFYRNISDDNSKHFMNSFENRVAIFVAVGIVCLLATLLITVLAIVVMRKRHRHRKYLMDKKSAFLRTYPNNGSSSRRLRSNSGVMTTPLNSTLDRPRNGFDILLAKEKGIADESR